MALDLEASLTVVYAFADDLHRQCVLPKPPLCGGQQPSMGDGGSLCLGLAGRWRAGVPCRTRVALRAISRLSRRLDPALPPLVG